MKIVDIMETIVNFLEKKLFEEWKHEGHCDGFSPDIAYIVIDGTRYCIYIREMREGEIFEPNEN